MTYDEFRVVLLLLGWKEVSVLARTWTNDKSEIKFMSWGETIRCHLKTEVEMPYSGGPGIRHISQHNNYKKLLKIVLEGKDEDGNSI